MKPWAALPVAIALAVSAAPAASQADKHRIGFLQIAPGAATRHLQAALEAGLRERGYVPGKNVVMEYRFADGEAQRLPALAAELVALRPDAIVTVLNPVTHAVKGATTTIPIVTALGTDMVESGLVQSLSRPGGNVTGMTLDVGREIIGKRLQLLREAAPGTARIAVLAGPASMGGAFRGKVLEVIEQAATGLGLKVREVELPRSPQQFAASFAAMAGERATALYVYGDPFTFANRRQLVELAAQHRLPTIFGAREYVDSGGLIAYGADLADLFRRSAGHVDRILKGARPGELPVEQPSKFELIVNQKTARTLNLTMPASLLLQADTVLQ